MTEEEANRILLSTWLAVKKGDKKVAREYLRGRSQLSQITIATKLSFA